MTREEAMYLLNNLRSVAEGKEDKAIDMAVEALQVDLVRCRGCKYWNEGYEFCQISESLPTVTRADSYCSYGERISDE